MRYCRAIGLQLCIITMSCGYYDSSLLAPLPQSEGGSGAGGSGAAGAGSCQHAFPPDKPTASNSGGELDLTFVVKRLTFGMDAGGSTRTVGYDIDKTCSCQGEKDSCLEPSYASPHCDGPEGRDNGFGALVKEAGLLVPDFGENNWNDRLADGAWSLVLRVRNYNGEANDDQVELDWYIPDAFWTIIKQQDGGKPPPKYDGTDEWPIRAFCVDNSDLNQPKFADPKAYVSSGVVVGMLPKGVIDSQGWISMVLTDAYLTGKLLKVGSGWEIQEGNIAAVWTLDDVFAQLGYMDVAGVPMCNDPKNQIYTAVKGLICKHVDIYRSRGTPTTSCDSLSLGLGFDAVSAKLGPLTPAVDKQMKCSADQNPANDSCDK